jgi:hypothetical protein
MTLAVTYSRAGDPADTLEWGSPEKMDTVSLIAD